MRAQAGTREQGWELPVVFLCVRGVEYWLVPLVWVARMGTTVDTRGSAALTVGTGMAFGKRSVVTVTYQYGMFPELRPEFGRAQTFALSVVIGFWKASEKPVQVWSEDRGR